MSISGCSSRSPRLLSMRLTSRFSSQRLHRRQVSHAGVHGDQAQHDTRRTYQQARELRQPHRASYDRPREQHRTFFLAAIPSQMLSFSPCRPTVSSLFRIRSVLISSSPTSNRMSARMACLWAPSSSTRISKQQGTARATLRRWLCELASNLAPVRRVLTPSLSSAT